VILLIPIVTATGAWWLCFCIMGLIGLLVLGILEPAHRTVGNRIEALEHRHEREAANDRLKSQFLAHLSHEVRTPMTSILGFIELLETGSPSIVNQRECLTTIRRNAEHLLSLLDCILDRSKLEAGAMKPELAACRPSEFLHDTVALLQLAAREKGIGLELEFKTPPFDLILTDPTRIKQILFNLIGNAVKFTERGSVRVVVTSNTSDRRMIVEVIDTGVGIEAGELDQLFMPYVQATRHDGKHFRGTGLGLSISRQLAEMLGGSLTASSESGQGSNFRLEIPAPEPGPEAKLRERSPTFAGAVRKILLADDGIDSRRLLMFQLQRAGATVESVEDGLAACRLAEEASRAGVPFDLVLLDLNMPRMDGFGAARRLRDQGFIGPVIALTASLSEEARNDCLLAGFDDMATKPIPSRALIELCDKHFGKRRPLTSAA